MKEDTLVSYIMSPERWGKRRDHMMETGEFGGVKQVEGKSRKMLSCGKC